VKRRLFNLGTLLSLAVAAFFSLGVLGWRDDAGWWASTGNSYYYPPLEIGVSPGGLTVISRSEALPDSPRQQWSRPLGLDVYRYVETYSWTKKLRVTRVTVPFPHLVAAALVLPAAWLIRRWRHRGKMPPDNPPLERTAAAA
jgi:hypothetical protein